MKNTINWAYIAGFLDGDGWITFSKNKHCDTYYYVVGFTQIATRIDFMREIYKFLQENKVNATFIERDSKNNIDPKGYTKMINIHIKEIRSLIFVLKNILPFILLKRDKAENCLKYLLEKESKRCYGVQKPSGYKSWTKSEIKRLITMHNNGFNHNVIAKSLYRSTNSISQKFDKLKKDKKWKILINKKNTLVP